MYYDWKRWEKYLAPYAIEPDIEVGEGWHTYKDWSIVVPKNPTVVITGKAWGVQARIILATLNNVGVHVLQIDQNIWVNRDVWAIPADFDWSPLLPISDEIYTPVANVFTAPIGHGYVLNMQAHVVDSNSLTWGGTIAKEDGTQIMVPVYKGETPCRAVVSFAGNVPDTTRAPISCIYTYDLDAALLDAGIVKEVSSFMKHHILNIPDDIMENLKAFMVAECQRLVKEVAEAIDNGKTLTVESRSILSIMVHEMHGNMNVFELSPMTVLEAYRPHLQAVETDNAEWDAREKAGIKVVALKRCWECGRAEIVGEIQRNGRIVRMPKEEWSKARDAKAKAHANATPKEPVIMSSMGFTPDAPEVTGYEFWIVNDDWYCGC